MEPAESFSVPFNGNELIGIIARDFRELWAKQPFYMSAASSNFPGLAGSRDMINGFNVFEARSKKNEVLNKWAREVLLGVVNAAGNEMKDRIFKPTKGDRYHLHMPNPNLVEQVAQDLPRSNKGQSRRLYLNLLDGGYTDNTGISMSLYYLFQKYENDKMPTIVSLLHSSSFEGNIDEIRNFFEHDGGFMEFSEKQIFQWEIRHKEVQRNVRQSKESQGTILPLAY